MDSKGVHKNPLFDPDASPGAWIGSKYIPCIDIHVENLEQRVKTLELEKSRIETENSQLQSLVCELQKKLSMGGSLQEEGAGSGNISCPRTPEEVAIKTPGVVFIVKEVIKTRTPVITFSDEDHQVREITYPPLVDKGSKHFVYSFHKCLTINEVTDVKLHLPVAFCREAFKDLGDVDTQVYLENEEGERWEAKLLFGKRGKRFECCISKGWKQYYLDNNLKRGDDLCFGVPNIMGDTIYVKMGLA